MPVIQDLMALVFPRNVLKSDIFAFQKILKNQSFNLHPIKLTSLESHEYNLSSALYFMKIRPEMPKVFKILQHPTTKRVQASLYALSDNWLYMLKSFLLDNDIKKMM